MIFENPQIETSQLPSMDDIEYKKLAPAYKKTEYIATAIFFAFLLVGAVAAFYNVPPEFKEVRSGVFIIWTALFVLSMYLAGKRYEMSGYALREHDVIHKYGVWWRTVTVIPFNRMQHCEISQGPVQNVFGLATLRVFTAGGNSSDLAIDGLEHEEAKRIKDFITEKIGLQSSVDNSQSSVHPAAGFEQPAVGLKREEGGVDESDEGNKFPSGDGGQMPYLP